MWRALAGSWPPVGCHQSSQHLTLPLQTQFSGGLWPPGTLPPATDSLPPAAGSWPDVADAAPRKEEIK